MPFSNTSSETTITPKYVVGSSYYVIGISLAVLGNLLIAVSLNIQKYAHRSLKQSVPIPDNREESQSNNSSDSYLCNKASYLKSKIWWAGIILMVFGECGNFIAYGFAPASVVAPLGSIAVIANGAIAVFFNKETLRMRDIYGATFAIVGGFLIVEFSTKEDKILDAEGILLYLGGWQFIVYMFVEISVFVTLIILKKEKSRINADFSVINQLLLVAILASGTVISAKAVSGMLAISFQGDSQLVYPIFYVMLLVMIVTTIVQVKYLNEAMAVYDIAVVVPVNFVLFTVSAILAGAIFYKEFFNQSGFVIFMFLFGCALSFLGVVFITGDKSSDKVEPGAFHLDMMPNSIRSLAASVKLKTVQPRSNPVQDTSYPDNCPDPIPVQPLLQN